MTDAWLGNWLSHDGTAPKWVAIGPAADNHHYMFGHDGTAWTPLARFRDEVTARAVVEIFDAMTRPHAHLARVGGDAVRPATPESHPGVQWAVLKEPPKPEGGVDPANLAERLWVAPSEDGKVFAIIIPDAFDDMPVATFSGEPAADTAIGLIDNLVARPEE